ncbi:ABC transporter ATP-binding protein [Vibrio sp. LaRot3]|uniref:ABC transporter ATP-binding protein n=1 Tax=Vibrio sp. LaRot3 TaxID=2998829 RepID=UPI0022CE34D1|nr:ABC transporter ATP-binding protein [Vibrio sp. LaRot3]MDA0148244.1 ABC transporter ATP-binding protein [Vibrio sp. LaRot3]
MHLHHSMTKAQAFSAMLRSEPRRLALSVSAAVITSVVEFALWLSIFLTAQAVLNQQPIYGLISLVALFIILRYSFYLMAVWQAHLVAYHIMQRVRQHIVWALARMPAQQLHKFHRADLEKRINADCQQLEPLIAHHGTDVINGLLMPVLLTGLLFYIDWRIGIIAFLPLPFAIVIQTLLMRGFAGRHEKYNTIVAAMHSAQLEFLRSIGVMKLFGVDAESYRKLYTSMRRHNKLVNAYTAQMITGWVSFVTIAQASFILIVPFAIYFTISGSMNLAELTMVSAITAGLLKPWLDLTQIMGQVQQSSIAINRMLPLFGEPSAKGEDQPQIISFNEALQSLSCRDICIDRGERNILSHINSQIEPGQRVYIQGESGSGKSSLVEALSGLLDTTNGDWFINEQSVKTLTDKQRSQYVSLVSQHTQFFKGSLKQNLLLARPSTELSELWHILSLLKLDKLVSELPNQLDTDIGETKRSFSGGEMQRLAIVRAMVAKTPVLILDEATAHLDTTTEQQVLSALRDFAPQQIQLIINHRNHAVSQYDQKWTIKQGALMEECHG